MSLTYDHPRRRMMMAARRGFSGPVISRAVAAAIRADPKLASYDFVMDVRESDRGSTLQDFQIVLGAYNEVARDPGLKYGCYVTEDPHYKVWADGMAALFGDRTCPVFPDPEEAHAFLDRQRGF